MKLTKDTLIEGKIVKAGADVLIQEDTKFDYMMLSRLKSDADYYAGYGGGSARNLYYKDEKEHYEAMVDLFNKLPEEPEWLTKEDLEKYRIILLGR